MTDTDSKLLPVVYTGGVAPAITERARFPESSIGNGIWMTIPMAEMLLWLSILIASCILLGIGLAVKYGATA